MSTPKNSWATAPRRWCCDPACGLLGSRATNSGIASRRKRAPEFLLIDPASGTRQPAFDHAKVAAGLSAASGKAYEASKLPFTEIEFASNRQAIRFTADRKRWNCDVAGAKCALEGDAGRGSGRGGRAGGRGGDSGPAARNESLSPDKKRAVFIRDNNLWARDVATNQETQLTRDGVKDFGYSTDNAGWAKSERPVVQWSPDSKKVATFQQDQRGVGEMYLVETKVGHPTLQAWKYPLPGDEVVTTIQRVIIDVADPHTVRLKMPADQHRSTLCDNLTCRGSE
jgi:hypothetical protein